MSYADIYYPTFPVPNPVSISFVEGTQNQFTVSWAAVPGAVGYNVYGSPSINTRNLLTPAPIAITSFTYSITPYISRDIAWSIWVSWLDSHAVETLLSSDPISFSNQLHPFYPATSPQSTVFGQDMIFEPAMAYYANEIRRRHKVMLENDGEDYDVYLRRWTGKDCPHDDERRASDPDYNTLTKCPYCFGTGILGGFYDKLVIKFRYNDVPQHRITFTSQGVVYGHDFNSWTLWTPILREQDVLVHKTTGDRFMLAETAKSSWRGAVTQQKLKLLSLQTGDIRYTITDAAIAAALSSGGTLPYEKPTIWG